MSRGRWAQAGNTSNWINWVVSPSASRPNTLFANNPFLAPATQQQLGASIVCGTPAATGWRCLPAAPATSPQTGSTPPPPPTTPYFSAPSYIWNKVGGQDADEHRTACIAPRRTRATWNAETGLTGSLGGLDWDVFYNHSQSRADGHQSQQHRQRQISGFAGCGHAPPGTIVNGVNVGGTIVCWVTTQPQFAGLYPGCVPTNITDPNGPSVALVQLSAGSSTSWTLTPEARRHRRLDRRRPVGLGPARPAKSGPTCRPMRAGPLTTWTSDVLADRVRQLHGPAHVSGQRRCAGALGAEHQCAGGCRATTSSKSRWK